MKDFDTWNIQKKQIQEKAKNRFYHERDIWWCALGLNIGHEQDGNSKNHDRPVLILKRFNNRICLILPLTTSHRKSIYKICIGKISGKYAYTIISQIRLIDIKRLHNRITVLDKKVFRKIKRAVQQLFL